MSISNRIDPHLKGIIDTVLDDFVRNRRMFTAFDVTRAVRNAAGTGTHIFHEVVKQYVHDRWSDGRSSLCHDYDRTTIPIGSPPPWCYYIPCEHDPSLYPGVAIATQQATTPAYPRTSPNGRQGRNPSTKPIMATFGGIRRSH